MKVIGTSHFFKWLALAFFLGLVALLVWQIYFVKVHYAKLPVVFTDAGVPVVEVEIGEKRLPLIVDLGSKLELSLDQEVLNTIPHTPHVIESVKNFRGTQFNRSTYQLPKLRLGSIEFNHPIALGRPKQDGQEYVIWQSSDKESKQVPYGAIGRGLLKKTNLLIDMRRSLVILTDHKKRLKRDGYQLDTYVKVPFRLDAKGIIIALETDLGQKRFLVDTGFTLTMLHTQQFPSDPTLAEREYNLPTHL